MRFFIFQSDAGAGLRAFAGDAAGRDRRSSLGLGLVRPGTTPPFNLSRDTIEKAISSHGTSNRNLNNGTFI
jgi:hypothetical protein